MHGHVREIGSKQVSEREKRWKEREREEGGEKARERKCAQERTKARKSIPPCFLPPSSEGGRKQGGMLVFPGELACGEGDSERYSSLTLARARSCCDSVTE